MRHSNCTQTIFRRIASLLRMWIFPKHVYLLQFDKVVSKTSTLTSGKRTRRRSTRDLISASPKGGKCSIQFPHCGFA
jgi:hypothetical protein